ncbi:hypothetical protein [Methylobacterium sp. Leaf361]|uniref:hypothetical protein n=1 Tax=Methylobacterium sp. Leaf361 TaxID=1736352 RepID=UPI000B179F21|nr:hypothetical protein [Methylobacterium sp. Leaf361]
MKTSDKIKFRFESDADHEGISKDAVGLVLRAEDLPANPKMVEVEFGGKKLWGYRSESRFMLVDPTG